MKTSFNPSQARKAREDVIRVYEIAEERLKKSCIWIDEESCRNAFQVFRYAFREWALRESRGVVLRALMVADKRSEEVTPDFIKNGKVHFEYETHDMRVTLKKMCGFETEVVIGCNSEDTSKVIEELLERDGYEESTDCR